MQAPEVLGGRYELRGVLGRGGMAEVRDGWDIRLDRPVAVEAAVPDIHHAADNRMRFESRRAAAAPTIRTSCPCTTAANTQERLTSSWSGCRADACRRDRAGTVAAATGAVDPGRRGVGAGRCTRERHPASRYQAGEHLVIDIGAHEGGRLRHREKRSKRPHADGPNRRHHGVSQPRPDRGQTGICRRRPVCGRCRGLRSAGGPSGIPKRTGPSWPAPYRRAPPPLAVLRPDVTAWRR